MRMAWVAWLAVVAGVCGCGAPGLSQRCRTDDDCLPWRACGPGGACGAPLGPGVVNTGGDAGSGSGADAGGGGGGDAGAPDAGTPDAGDPGECERDERYVVVTENQDRPVRVFRPQGGLMLEVVPTGYQAGDGAVVASGNSTLSPESGALHNGRVLLGTITYLVAVSTSTLRQVDVTPTQPYVPLSAGSLVLQEGVLVGMTSGTESIRVSDEVWSREYHSGGGHRLIPLSLDGTPMLASASTDTVFLWSVAGGTLTRVGTTPTSRLSAWGDSQYGRALAYEPIMDALLVGLTEGVAMLHPGGGFTVPPATEDWEIPGPDQYAYAAATEPGVAWVSTGRFLYRLDLSTTPPTTTGTVTYAVEAFRAWKVVVGCRRVLVVKQSAVEAFDRRTLAPLGVVSFTGDDSAVDLILSSRTELAVDGDTAP